LQQFYLERFNFHRNVSIVKSEGKNIFCGRFVTWTLIVMDMTVVDVICSGRGKKWTFIKMDILVVDLSAVNDCRESKEEQSLLT